MQLQGKTALVTGATSGIGEAIAHAFAHEGAQVVVSGRDAQRGLAVAQAIGQQSRFCVVADLTSSTDIARLISETRKLVGSIDILVNNAGIFPIDETARIDAATFDAVIATNVKALFFLTAAFAPHMAERRSGKIINITTVLAHKGFSGGALYGASKAALALLTKAWAAEFGPSGVNVNAIAPHLVRTPGTEDSIEGVEEIANSLPARDTPCQWRLPKPRCSLPATRQTISMA
jgi:NAD(P)-dependent dehydrogenase (short-subunit alcohol dehydrogenase family)